MTVAYNWFRRISKSRVVLLKSLPKKDLFFTLYNWKRQARIEGNLKYVSFFGIVWTSGNYGLPKEPQKSFLIIILIQDQKEVS
jgi:hypothetical protein